MSDFWETRYAERDQIWSGKPNDALVSTVAPLKPGRALDLGCGEGADAVWLAEQGWQVTAVDISSIAIDRARALAASHDIPNERITWLVADLSSWEPADEYDLVTACFLHSPVDFPRSTVLQRAASTITSGGYLLVVGHAEPPPWASWHHHHAHDEEPGPALDGADWDTQIDEIRPRPATGPNGEQAILKDSVILARRIKR